jgi:GntR family transcriptional regulator/MocR family aminotransferase
MFPYKTTLKIDRTIKTPLYLQLANQFIVLIKNKTLPPKTKLLGSRHLALLLKVHRNTIVACYEELILQGWIESIPKKGTFVPADLPELVQQEFSTQKTVKLASSSNFRFTKKPFLTFEISEKKERFMYLNDGVSDERLTPINEIGRLYRSVASKKTIANHLTYGSPFGNGKLREVLTDYLNKTRGLNITTDNILITRGSQMGIYLASKMLFQDNDIVVVGETNYSAADTTFIASNAQIRRIPVDKNGLNTKALEVLCKKQHIKAVYVTSHHHHPTTVTLSAKRRIHLLNLSEKYNFAIIEDDYDYDFNYNHSPILPLASHDRNGNVIYIGSICKTVAPVFRIGYLIAPTDFVIEAANLRRIVDRQGDALLELTFAEFIENGNLDRHIKKVIKQYKIRRDLFCELLKNELSNFFTFEIPLGGMAVWVTLHKNYSWETLSKCALKQRLDIGNWKRYDFAKTNHNAIRIGFAKYNSEEIQELIKRLKCACEDLARG